MSESDRYVITSPEGHTAECLAYEQKTRRHYCIADCAAARHARKLAAERTGCSCFHAPEQHGRMGCSMMGCECAWNGEVVTHG